MEFKVFDFVLKKTFMSRVAQQGRVQLLKFGLEIIVHEANG